MFGLAANPSNYHRVSNCFSLFEVGAPELKSGAPKTHKQGIMAAPETTPKLLAPAEENSN
jgi:hypothetical protein